MRGIYKNRYTLLHESGRVQFQKYFGKPIEEYQSFQKAIQTVKPTTITSYLNVLSWYFLYLNQDPDTVIKQRKLDLLSDNDSERYETKTILYLKSFKEKSLAGMSIRGYKGRIQGFFRNNGKRLSLDLSKLKVSKARKHKKYSPDNETVKAIFNKAELKRDRLIVALMYQNGPAPVDVSLLCCGDYPQEPWQYFERERSKTGEVWRGVSTPDVCMCLKEYLILRGDYKSTDKLFFGREGPLDAIGVGQIVTRLIDDTGFGEIVGFKPTSFRDAFEDALVDAEIYRKVKEALMAHNSGIEGEYGSDAKMQTRIIEAMKKTYPLLCLNEQNQNVDLQGLDLEKLGMVLERFDDLIEVADLVKNKKFLNLDDPDLLAKLKAADVIK